MDTKRIRSLLTTYKPELIIFFVTLGIRTAYALVIHVFVGEHGFTAYSDANYYVTEAQNILTYHSFGLSKINPLLPDGLRTPLYPLFLAACFKIGLSFFSIIMLQNVMAAITATCTWRIGVRYFSKKTACIAALFVGVEIMSIYWGNLTMSDTLFSMILLFTVWAAITNSILLLGLAAGIATLGRPIALYFFPILLLYTILVSKISKRSLLRVGIACLLFVLIISPWVIRNKYVFGTYSLSSAGLHNLYTVELDAYATRVGIPHPMLVAPPHYPADAVYGYDLKNSQFYSENIKRIIFAKPFTYIRFHIISSLLSFFDNDYNYIWRYVIAAKLANTTFVKLFGAVVSKLADLTKFVWLAAGLAALIGATAHKNPQPLRLFFGALILVNALLVGYLGTLSGSRFNLPMMPLIALLAVDGVFISSSFFKAGIAALRCNTVPVTPLAITSKEVAHLSDSVVLLDIDGTITPDNETEIQTDTVRAVASLAQKNRVYLCTNSRNSIRNYAIQKTLSLPIITVHHKKPSKKILQYIPDERRSLVVIGDKFFTDFLLAVRCNARFIRIRRVTSKRGHVHIRLINTIDTATFTLYNILTIFLKKI